MNRTTALAALTLLLILTGCASTNEVVSDPTPRPPTKAVEVFKDGQIPQKQFKQIAELSFLGPREDELRAEKFFIRRAQKLGGNGILFSIVPAGERGAGLFGANGGGFGVSTAWVFKGNVIVYE